MLRVKVYPNETSWKFISYPKIESMRYRISIYGDVIDTKSNRNPDRWISEKGYHVISLNTDEYYKKPIKVHRMVAYEYIGKNIFDNNTVNHINGDKNDNSIYNLEIISFSDNIKYSYSLGLNTPRRGTLNGMNKFSEEIIIFIKKLINDGYSTRKIRPLVKELYGVEINRYLVFDIRHNKTWKHLE